MRTFLSIAAYTVLACLFIYTYFFNPLGYAVMAVAFAGYGLFHLTRQFHRHYLSRSSL